MLHRWRQELQDCGTRAFAGNGQRRADESQVAELERKAGRQALEIDFLRRCSQHVVEQRRVQALDSATRLRPCCPSVQAASETHTSFKVRGVWLLEMAALK